MQFDCNLKLGLLLKIPNFGYNFWTKRDKLSYYRYVFFVTRPFCLYQNFSTDDFETFLNNFYTRLKILYHIYFITDLQKLGAEVLVQLVYTMNVQINHC